MSLNLIGVRVGTDTSLTQTGIPADAKAVGDALENVKIKHEVIGDWNCLTLDCGIKIATFHGRYGNTKISSAEGALYWENFSKNMPTGFFGDYPTVITQCEVESGYGLYITLDTRTSNKDTLCGWFYTDKPITCNPHIHIFCIGA